MTIYFTLTFLLLILEMAAFAILVLPLPVRWRRAMMNFITNSPTMNTVLKGVKYIFAFVLILFIDTVNRLQRIGLEQDGEHKTLDFATEASQKATRFYAQRNMYLTGFTLFLSLILERTTALVTDMVRRDEQVQDMKKQSAIATGDQKRLKELEASYKAQIATLKSELSAIKAKDLDIDNLKKRSAQLSDEYDEILQQVITLRKK